MIEKSIRFSNKCREKIVVSVVAGSKDGGHVISHHFAYYK